MTSILLLALVAVDDAPAPVDPKPPTVTVAISPQQAKVGERIHYDIAVRHQGHRTFALPDSLDFGAFELVDQERLGSTPPDADGFIVESYRVVLTLFEPGRQQIADWALPYVDTTGTAFTLAIPGGEVHCASVIANVSAPQFKPPPAPIPVIVEDRRLLYGGVLVLAMLLAGGLGTWISRRRTVRQAPPPPPIPPEVIALGRLARLKARELLRKGLVEEFFQELSHILREYVGNRYEIGALEMTTDELLEHLTEQRLRGVRRSTIKQFLGESDLVKFARHRPDDEETAEIFRIAEEIIERTTPAPAPEPAS